MNHLSYSKIGHCYYWENLGCMQRVFVSRTEMEKSFCLLVRQSYEHEVYLEWLLSENGVFAR